MKTPLNARLLQSRRRFEGFTLIELMITVAIVAILAAIAYPSYRNYVIRGQVVEATNILSAMRANMERFYQDNRQYTDVTTATPAILSPCNAANLPTATNFAIACPTWSAQTFMLQAVGKTTGPVSGFTYSVTQAPVLSSGVASPAPSAWRITCTSSWTTRAGSC